MLRCNMYKSNNMQLLPHVTMIKCCLISVVEPVYISPFSIIRVSIEILTP